MQWGHAFVLLVSSTAFSVVSADWRTYGKIWSKDHGGEANPDFRGYYKINVFIEPDQFLASCGKTKADAKGRYDITCTPLIIPFTDPGKLVKVCHRVYGRCLCQKFGPVKRGNPVNFEISNTGSKSKLLCSKEKYPE
ncbi:unnamed protein product [Bursaphelenchus xylophilus]|uniref:(pine wood nematode) hypothetical protein n=1 Tax=Bursaphelenchus xylophilus TaxID=6326 RepID=A0A1I7SEN0_BURXY|nr:unnamed protein product [Bursaphelenchus xylophilus]CAG9113665.1 unnamed protein product [Bursaphelenchus xylophilus]